MNAHPLRRRAIAALILVNLLWGISFPVMKMTNELMTRHLDGSGPSAVAASRLVFDVASASFFVTLRFALALGLVGLCMPRLFLGMTVRQWLMGAGTGLAFSAGFILQVMALNEIPASRSGFLTSLSVVFTPLLAIAVERRSPHWAVLSGAAIALFGTAILTGVSEIGGTLGVQFAPNAIARIGVGDWLTVLAAMIFAVQIVLIDFFGRRMPPAKLTPGMFVATLCVGAVVFALAEAVQPRTSFSAWGGLLVDLPFMLLTLATSLFCTVLAFYWMNRYQPDVAPAHAALVYTLEPVFATAWAMCLPGLISPLVGLDYPSERPGLAFAAGGLLVVAGNALALWQASHPTEQP